METRIKNELVPEFTNRTDGSSTAASDKPREPKSKTVEESAQASSKRRCVSTACIACRRRKSKCDGNLPKCAACASVYLTECEYAPHTDHRRKGVYKKDGDSSKTKNSTFQTLIQALVNYEEDAAHDLLRQIRVCDNLEELSQTIEKRDKGLDVGRTDSPIYTHESADVPQFEAQLSSKMGDLVIDGAVKFIGGTSNLIWLNDYHAFSPASPTDVTRSLHSKEEAILGWTKVTQDRDLILHFMNMYFCWHYAYFTTLSKQLFYRDFLTGTTSQYCSPLLVNVMLALGCHFSSIPAARADPDLSSTTGDHFFAEAKKLLHEDDEFANPKLCTVQALALMSVREAGCGRESRGWVYSGMSFRMASDLGLNVDIDPSGHSTKLTDEEVDARSITFWGCFFFDKCWSNYLGRQPQLPLANTTVRKPGVFASEDSEMWSPYTDSGIVYSHSQPARTRAIALQSFKLAEISSDLLTAFYQPQNIDKAVNKQAELKKLTDIHTRLEAWKKELPAELEPKDWQLPAVLLMHMFYQLLYIHLYRPFLKYTKSTSPLPSHISPRKYCTQAAAAISKLFRLYKRTHGLRQICNIAVYIAHSACTIHLLNLPDKNARRDIVHGIKHLQEIGECWTCARRTLRILSLCAEQWNIELPEETQAALTHVRQRWGSSEPTTPAMSPNSMVDLTQQLDSQPISETMARNVQQQGHVQLPTTFSQSVVPVSSSDNIQMIPDVNYDILTPAPAVTQSIAEVPKPAFQLRALTQLTKAQQEAWNAHQSRMAGQQAPQAFAAQNNSKNAAVMFGGVHSLMAESQDWWLKDQSQIALGFENWNSPTTDWAQAINTMDMVTTTGDSNMTSTAGSTPFLATDSMQDSFGIMPGGGQQMYRMQDALMQQPAPLQQQHSQQQQYLPQQPQQQQQQPDVNTTLSGIPENGMSNSRKRVSTFEDGNVFY